MTSISKLAAPLTGFLLALITLGAAWAEPVVITHPSVSLQASEIKDVFTGNKQFAGSTKLVLVDNLQAQDKFVADVLKSEASKYRSIWARKVFQDGITPPITKGTDAEVIDFVRRTPGGVGYVSTPLPAGGGVNVVGK